jgi:predicted O-linked N-acetylglucosamine transferase (SPINDLY family)
MCMNKSHLPPLYRKMNKDIEFNDQFLTYFKYGIDKTTEKWYNHGINIVLNTTSLSHKEDILNKLVIIYPNKYEIYYYMGCIYKDKYPYKAFLWFQICFQLNPYYVENILDYVKTLFDLDMVMYFSKWYDSHHNIIDNINDLRVKYIIAAFYVKLGKLQKALDIYTYLVENIHEMPKQNIIFTYSNYAFILGKLGYLKETFLNYYKIIFPWITANKNEDFLQAEDAKLCIRSLYENYIIMYDYCYHDTEKRFALCREINNIYISSPSTKYTHNIIPTCILNKELPPSISIGYVSNDFQEHAVSNFIIPILKHHSPFFKIHLFTQKAVNISQVHSWNTNIITHSINYVDDDECAKLISDLKIDILIDLNGYTAGHRLSIFARTPSPIQVTYIGYPNSLCLDFIQYRITDSIADNKESKQIHTETLFYMPKCFLLFESMIQTAPIQLQKKNEGPILFGSLNRELKNSAEVLQTWAEIMKRVPNSHILIKIDSNDMYESRKEYYSKALNIDPSRIEIACKCTNAEYIELFSRIDILLDTFPYSGTTTTCNALYNSVPVITLYNKDYHCNNVSSSLLMNTGLGDFVAYSIEQYIEKAVILSTIQIDDRELIHQKFMKLMDPRSFMDNYENMLLKLYVHHWKNKMQQYK